MHNLVSGPIGGFGGSGFMMHLPLAETRKSGGGSYRLSGKGRAPQASASLVQSRPVRRRSAS
ncbi:hypothetical protein KL86PLE_40919 [uncultured Pleomorphomonas sp.]|uniref:Uncharacterized protein n=1 Tax=uncultured Pleomorphomonas sp. TaxID=442121 RepID=A0A212LHT7_9HYPH|nr:hypothetical protein KL86PLE_40919 [uncultured Pleomorphomonas sp.]